MKQNTTLILSIAAVLILIGSVMMILTQQNKPDAARVTPLDESQRYTLDNLGVSYAINQNEKELYDIRVVGVTSNDPDNASTDVVQISGKACNTQNGSFPIVSSDNGTNKAVLVELEDGRVVLDSPVVSTMMACIDMTDPKYDDAALTEIITTIAKSIQSI